ncbi:MAG TPA: hypothetical protein DD670_18670 [Planctomycetaceae bacterium]|nr:hypothetical protein [Planctomycetaceae bacterium]
MRVSVFLSLLLVLLVATSANAGLRAYWAFDEVGGDAAYDSSGNGNHGLLYAEIEAGDPPAPLPGTTPPSRVGGVNGGALLFGTPNGANYNSMVVAKSDSLKDLGGQWSIALWLRQDARGITPGGGSGYARVMSCPNYELELGVAGWEYDYWWPYDTPGMQTDIGTSYVGAGGSLGQWYHMAVTYDGTQLKKYLNGTLVPNSVKTVPNMNYDAWDTEGWAASPLKLGAQVWPSKDFFVGAMDDVAIWGDQYLSAQDVAELYAGTSNLLPDPIPEPGTLVLLICGALGFLSLRRR